MNGDLPANSTEQTEEDRLMDWDGTHPLSNSWVLWYSDRSTSKEWKDCIKAIGPFHTIEGFWSVFNHLKPMSNLKPGCDFYMFKMGILPMWEDKANKNGGRWDIQFERGIMREQIDTFWMELVMALVGEAFSAIGNIVTGACVTSRDKYSRISIWTSMANDKEKLIRLGRKVKQVLGLTHDQRIFFRTHEDSANSTYRQNGSISV